MIQVKTERVEFSDGTHLVVAAECWDTSMRIADLVKAAETKEPLPDVQGQVFRLAYYPFLAGSVIEGTPPSEEESRRMPIEDLDNWYKTVERLNPKFWAATEAAVEANQAEEEKKRKSRPQK